MREPSLVGRKNRFGRLLLCLATLLLVGNVLVWTGCGGGSSSNNAVTGGMPPAAATSSTQIKIGDAPIDNVVAFEVTVNSIALNPAGGGTPVTILSTPTRIEVMHTSATFEPLAVANIPQGMYGSATVTVSNPEVVVINAGTRQPQQLTVNLPSATVTVNFASPITISGTASVLLFDLNLANSVTIAGNTVTVNPTFTVRVSSIMAENEQEDENGEIEDVTGTVTGVSGSSFTLSVQQHATPLTFTTDANTQFKAPLANIGSLQVGMVVEVDAVTQSSGGLLATKVESEFDAPNGLELEGFVASVTGSPATQFTLVAQEIATPMANAPAIGNVITVNIASNTNFKFDSNHIDLSGLNFTFDATSLKPGQKVEVDVDPPVPATLTAKKVILKRQALSGTITNLTSTGTSTSTFTLNLDPVFSAFALVSNQPSVMVFRQPGTELKNMSTLSNGQTVRVRGLVFFDTSSSSYKMVAGRIVP